VGRPVSAGHAHTSPYQRDQVVVLPFPFSDLSATKRRPALIVATLEGTDLILCMITSRRLRDPWAIEIAASDFSEGGLPRTSYIRPTRLFTADSQTILRVAGTLAPATMERVVSNIGKVIAR
jgi:mRNA interferase MazF